MYMYLDLPSILEERRRENTTCDCHHLLVYRDTEISHKRILIEVGSNHLGMMSFRMMSLSNNRIVIRNFH